MLSFSILIIFSGIVSIPFIFVALKVQMKWVFLFAYLKEQQKIRKIAVYCFFISYWMDFLDNNPQIIKMNKSSKIVDMIFKLNEINNSDNLEDGRPSNNLFTYHLTGSEDLTHLKPHTPKYKIIKNGRLNSLTLRITDQDGNVITNGPGTTVVFHIRDCK